MKIFIFLLTFFNLLMSAELQMPILKFRCSGAVTDIVIQDKRLYASTDAGKINVFKLNTSEHLYSIEIDKITNFMGDTIDSKIYSIDVLGKRILILSQAEGGYRQVHLYEAGELKSIISKKDMLYIAEAKFSDQETLLFGTLGNELIAYNTKEKIKNYQIQVSQSRFSKFALNEDRSEVACADESGNIHIHNTKDGLLKKVFKDQNLDNVFQVDFKNFTIATAGKDRRTVIYNLRSGSAYYKTSPFFIYAVALSPSAKLAAFSSDEENNIAVFDTQTQSVLAHYGGVKMTPNKILFIDEKHFLVASDDHEINMYKIK